jgi:hypothetical protein
MTIPLVHFISSFYSKNRALFSMPISHTVPLDFKTSAVACTSNDDCMNMDSYRSKPGSAPVYSCPAATCSGGACECGTDCKNDPRVGYCCQDLEVIGEDVFCVESKDTPLNIKDDNLATDMILDSAGNPWDYISSPNNAMKRAGVKGKAAMLAHKKAHILSKTKDSCNIPDQILYSKDKKQHITVPGQVVCNIYKKYQ